MSQRGKQDNTPTGKFTNDDGEFKLAIDEPGNYKIKPVYTDGTTSHLFQPAVMNRLVKEDILNLQFEDTTFNELNGSVLGPCKAFIGKADIKITSYGVSSGCYDTTITTNGIGNYRISLPAQAYILEVVDIDPYNPNIIQ